MIKITCLSTSLSPSHPRLGRNRAGGCKSKTSESQDQLQTIRLHAARIALIESSKQNSFHKRHAIMMMVANMQATAQWYCHLFAARKRRLICHDIGCVRRGRVFTARGPRAKLAATVSGYAPLRSRCKIYKSRYTVCA